MMCLWSAEALIDRRIVPQKWLEQHKQIRDGLAKLYTDLPLLSEDLAGFRAKHVDHEQLHYFDCKHVMTCLQNTDEGAARNFFGQYTSPVLKQWDALLKMYEKNNVFAADAARHIAHNTAYEMYVSPWPAVLLMEANTLTVHVLGWLQSVPEEGNAPEREASGRQQPQDPGA